MLSRAHCFPSAQSRDVESSPAVAQGTQNTPQAPFCPAPPAVAASHLSQAVCVGRQRLGSVPKWFPAPCLGPEVPPARAGGEAAGSRPAPEALQTAARSCARCCCCRLQFSDENQLIIFLKLAMKQRHIKLH